MTAYRICSGCDNPLTGKGPTAKTCSSRCRSKRSRRLARIRKENGENSGLPPELKEMSERVRGEVKDAAHKVIEEELRPVVRETITEDTLRAIRDLVGLTPMAVAAIADDLASPDAVLRQKAYALLMKYTVGHGAIVTPAEQDKSQPLVVNFELPRPRDAESSGEPAVEAEVVGESRECDTCHQMKPDDQFIAGSDRCEDCFAGMHDKQQALIEETAPTHSD